MQALGFALLLALSAAAEPADPRPEPSRIDPCAAAREIVRQPPCLANGDCEALQLWRRSFGGPRIEPLGPNRAAYRSLVENPGARRRLPRDVRHRPPDQIQRWPRSAAPPPGQQRRPGFVCPAGVDPPG